MLPGCRRVSEWLVPDWPAPANVIARATTRSGGVSEGRYGTFNLGGHVGDAPAAMRENRRRFREALGLLYEPGWLQQVHGNTVVDAGDTCERPPEADASVSREIGRASVVLTADCLPVLFAAVDGSVVGAAHAGWRGLLGGILENTVRALEAPPAALLAWLGPAISQAAFEVGAEVRAAYTAADPAAAVHFAANARGRYQADLYALARQRLANAGVDAVFGGGFCTYTDRDRFYSYRRDGECGRMASVIALTAAPGT